MISELKAFLFRGDVLALAVAVIIAGAFQKIIDSMVADVIMPIVGMVAGNPDFSSIMVGSVKIGNFLNAVVNFLIVSFAIFIIVKQIARLQRKQAAEAAAEPPPPPRSEVLLEEIRNLLKERK